MSEAEATGRDYSQFGEQAAILEHTPRVGTFLDVGAYDAFTFSNVRALYEDGWGGVVVEPHPGHAERLRKQYAYSLAVTVLELAVADTARAGGTVRLELTDDATSTADPATHHKWRDEIHYDGQADVQAVSIRDLWESHGPFQFVSLDAEGWSVPIFSDLLRECRPLPPCVCVEFDWHRGLAEHQARLHGYRVVCQNDTNLVFAL